MAKHEIVTPQGDSVVDETSNAMRVIAVGGCVVGWVPANLGTMGTMDAGLYGHATATQNRAQCGHPATLGWPRMDVLQGIEAKKVVHDDQGKTDG